MASKIFTKNVLMIPKISGKIFCGLMNFLERFEFLYIWSKTNTAFYLNKKHINSQTQQW